MTERERKELAETVDFINDPRTRARLIEEGPMYLLVEFDCKGAVRQPDGRIEIVDRHRVRFVRAENLHGLLAVFEPIGQEAPFHPNIRPTPPRIVCANIQQQLDRGPAIPLWTVVALVYDIISGASWAMSEGIYNAEAASWYTAAQARGELPFDRRALR